MPALDRVGEVMRREEMLNLVVKKIEKKFRKAWLKTKDADIMTRLLEPEPSDHSAILESLKNLEERMRRKPGKSLEEPCDALEPLGDVDIGYVRDEKGMIGKGWRKSRGGITMDSGAGVDIMPAANSGDNPT